MNRYCDLATYSVCPHDETAAGSFATVAFEEVNLDLTPFSDEEDVNRAIASGEFTKLMCEITLRVGASRYLTGAQITSYMMISDIEQDWKKISAAIKKLCALRVLRGVSLNVGTSRVMHAYMLNVFGIQLCKRFHLDLHKGLYRSKQERLRQGYSLIDSPADVRKYLEANSIVLRFLSAGHSSGSFEFGRCLRFEGGAALNDAVFRCALLIALSPENSFAVDVVRYCDDWLDSAAEKFSRYARMASCHDFKNHIVGTALTEAPLYIICAEDSDQVMQLRTAVQPIVNAHGIVPLFTTDQEINAFPQTVYMISSSGKKTLFSLDFSNERKEAC